MPEIQRTVVTAAAKLLRPGGLLLYSTCTFSKHENEETIERLIKEEGFTLLPLPITGGTAKRLASRRGSGPAQAQRRLFPHRLDGEGHFVALLQKNVCLLESDSAGDGFTKAQGKGRL